MTTTSRNKDQQVSIIRKELVALTQDSQVAIVLNQLLYWTKRVKDFDLFLEEERTCPSENYPSLNYGWIYKAADELIEETMLTVSRPTMRKYLKTLVEEGWIEEKRNPQRTWNQTAHFRLNLKRIHDELFSLGYRLSGFEKGLFPQDLTSEEGKLEVELKHLTEEEKNLTSKLENFPSKERNLTPKLKNLTAYTYTETTHKNTNKDHTQDARVCEKNFSTLNDYEKEKSIAQEMVDLWESHIVQRFFSKNWQGTIQLTEGRENQLESLFAFHFKNDIRLWEKFCLRIKSIPFLMGESSTGWHVTIDWILEKGNFIKVLEGNYDDPRRMEDEDASEWTSRNLDALGRDLNKSHPNPLQDAQKDAILASIKDPVWREWCTRLSKAVPLIELQNSHKPLSLVELGQIANARFLECEDDHLVWVGSSDQTVLNTIENLRLKIKWVFEKEYPKARTIRTRLDNPTLSQQLGKTGENHHA